MAKAKEQTAAQAPTPAAVAAEVAETVATAPTIGTPEFNSLTCEERTQIIAARKYAGGKKFLCTLRDQPSVTIAADSAAEAKERYMELCGIRFTEHQIGATPV